MSVWTPERLEEFKARLAAGQTDGDIARAMRLGRNQVIGKRTRLGIAANPISAFRRSENARLASAAAKRQRPKARAPLPVPGRDTAPAPRHPWMNGRGPAPAAPSDDRALIDAAIAAGRVTVLPPGHAVGLTEIERQLYAAPPPTPEGGWRAMNRKAAAR